MRQKVAVAASLIADPPIVLLDEPTIGLDVEATRTVKDWIRTLSKEQGKTILLTTHQMNVVEELCDSVAVIRKGQVVTDPPTDQLLARARERDKYEIKVDGTADGLGLPEGFTMVSGEETTLISGRLADPQDLCPVVDRLRAYGAVIESMAQVQPDLERPWCRTRWSSSTCRPSPSCWRRSRACCRPRWGSRSACSCSPGSNVSPSGAALWAATDDEAALTCRRGVRVRCLRSRTPRTAIRRGPAMAPGEGGPAGGGTRDAQTPEFSERRRFRTMKAPPPTIRAAIRAASVTVFPVPVPAETPAALTLTFAPAPGRV
jgi:hypothetical protein